MWTYIYRIHIICDMFANNYPRDVVNKVIKFSKITSRYFWICYCIPYRKHLHRFTHACMSFLLYRSKLVLF